MLTVLIYRIEIYLMLSSMDLWRIWENLWKQLPTWELSLPGDRCLGKKYHSFLREAFSSLFLLPTFYCQLENFRCPGTVAWGKNIPPFSGKPSLPVLTATFRDPHSPFELNNNTFKSFLSLYRQKFLQSLLFKKNVFI